MTFKARTYTAHQWHRPKSTDSHYFVIMAGFMPTNSDGPNMLLRIINSDKRMVELKFDLVGLLELQEATNILLKAHNTDALGAQP